MEIFKQAGFKNVKSVGQGIEEKMIDADTGKVLLEVNQKYFRPGEVPYLKGNN